MPKLTKEEQSEKALKEYVQSLSPAALRARISFLTDLIDDEEKITADRVKTRATFIDELQRRITEYYDA
jgi:predicted transcriptional regulator of viral defense system